MNGMREMFGVRSVLIGAVAWLAVAGLEAHSAPAGGGVAEVLRGAAARSLEASARRAGVAIEAEHTAVLVREDAALVVAPVAGLEGLGAKELVGQVLGFAEIGVGPYRGAYRMVWREEESPDGTMWAGFEFQPVDGGKPFHMRGGTVWETPDGKPDRTQHRVDLAVHEDDSGLPPDPGSTTHNLTITIWVQYKTWRKCVIIEIPTPWD